MNPNDRPQERRRQYVAPAIQQVQADPVTELLQSTTPCGSIADGCNEVGLPIC